MVRLWLAVWLVTVGGALAIPCHTVHSKCAGRIGCVNALELYMLHCSGLASKPGKCPEPCQNALIALMSNNEGKALMTCECNDDKCRQTKEQVEVCRPQVLKAIHNKANLTCMVAQWICQANTLCVTALKYYHQNCRSLFQGKRCSPRCKNSINILRKQDKADLLDTCNCDGREDYDCLSIRRNMDKLCFQKKPHPTNTNEESDISNEVVHEDPNPGSKLVPSLLLLLIHILVIYR